jgi:hypothetical protein
MLCRMLFRIELFLRDNERECDREREWEGDGEREIMRECVCERECV